MFVCMNTASVAKWFTGLRVCMPISGYGNSHLYEWILMNFYTLAKTFCADQYHS